MRFSLHPAAAQDLAAIRRYIAKDSPAAAERVAAVLLAAMRGLNATPHIGRPGRWSGTRELVIPPYVIPYRVKNQTVEILHVFHSAREWPDQEAA